MLNYGCWEKYNKIRACRPGYYNPRTRNMLEPGRIHMIKWPAVIKYNGDDELVYVSSEDEWIRDAASHLYNHSDGDCLIDSSGDIFSLARAQDIIHDPPATGDRISLESFIRLVRIHASNSHRCCIEKINFRNIAEGISLIASMNEQD